MARTKALRIATTPGEVPCPFRIVIDSREQRPYTFLGLRTNKDEGDRPIIVETITHGLPVGDYTLDGHPGGIIIERKSKEDMFASVVDRDNMKRRLGLMSSGFATAHWVVECEVSEVYRDPPTQYNPTSLMRSVWAWQQRYPVQWHWVPNRRFGEKLTFRLLERFHRDTTEHGRSKDHRHVIRNAYRRGVRDRIAGVDYKACPFGPHSAEEAEWDAGWREMDRDLSQPTATDANHAR